MQRNIQKLIGYTISAKDGELGKVSEFYFDDLTWSIRYLVVETGKWLSERKVLIPHAALRQTDWQSETFQVSLTMEQIRNSPVTDTEKTVSRQHEIDLFNHYALPVYWESGLYAGSTGMVPFIPIVDIKAMDENDELVKQSQGDPHLRSTNEVEGYHIHANDGEIGHVVDYIVDDEKWNICCLIADTRNWLPGRKVLIASQWITRIDWDESEVYVNLSRESIKNSPEYDPSKPISMDCQSELSNYHGDHTSQH